MASNGSKLFTKVITVIKMCSYQERVNPFGSNATLCRQQIPYLSAKPRYGGVHLSISVSASILNMFPVSDHFVGLIILLVNR